MNGANATTADGLAGIAARFRLARSSFALDVAFDLPARGVTAIFGPSGSGKTTLLRCMAGLERAPDSELRVHGTVWQDAHTFVPPHRRPVGYVFQEANLFAHLDVAGNLDFAARRAAPAQGAVNSGAHGPTLNREGIVELLGIGHLLKRSVQGLSGGERQRAAIARALLTRPQLLLLDEPLAALERERRRDILPYLERLRDELHIPMLYVTHAVDEVLRLAHHLLLLDAGRLVAGGPLAELAARLDLPLAQEPDAAAAVTATVGAHDFPHHLTRLDFSGGSLFASMGEIPRAPEVGRTVRISVQARDVSIALTEATDSSILNRLPAVIVSMAAAQHPGQCLVRLDAGGTALLARISQRSREQLGLHEGQRVWAQIKSVALLEP